MSNISKYFDGQGKIFIELNDGLSSGLEWVGDADKFELELTQKFDDVYESYTGLRTKAAHILTQTDSKIMLNMLNWSVDNLTRILQGTTAGAQASGTVTAEALVANPGKSATLKHFGVSAVVLTKASTPLVLGTDYTLDAKGGVVTFLSTSAVITAPGTAISAAYAFAAYSGQVQGLQSSPVGYRLVFVGIDIANGGAQVRVEVHNAILNLPKNLGFLDSKHGALAVDGEMLIDDSQAEGDSKFFTVMKA